MSTVANQLTVSNNQQSGKQNGRIWILAAAYPIVAAPVWLALPQTVLGPLHPISGLLLTTLLLTSTVTDLGCRKIYNWATYTTFAWAIAINALPNSIALDLGAIGFAQSLHGGLVCFLAMLFPYCLARGGAGDVKLAAAIGALVGTESGLLIIAFTYIVSAVAIIGWSIWTRGPLHLLSAMFRKAAYRFLPQFVLPPEKQQTVTLDQPVPLAGFFLVATLIVLFDIPASIRGL